LCTETQDNGHVEFRLDWQVLVIGVALWILGENAQKLNVVAWNHWYDVYYILFRWTYAKVAYLNVVTGNIPVLLQIKTKQYVVSIAFYVTTYRSYNLLKTIRFLAHHVHLKFSEKLKQSSDRLFSTVSVLLKSEMLTLHAW